MNLLHQFNKYSEEDRRSLIRKALDSSTGVGSALIPQHLEQVITNTVVRLSPELAMIVPEFDNQKLHEFNQLTTLPAAGGAMGENAVTPTRNATYTRQNVTLKVIRRKGAVTNFLQDASLKNVNSSAVEMENNLLSHVYDLVAYIMWGNAAANAYEFSGLDTFIQTNRKQEAVGGTALSSLKTLDDMIDANTRRQGKPHRKVFLMSPEMLSRVSQLLTNVRLNQGIIGSGLTQVEVNGGWRLSAYRDIPIIETTSLSPQAKMGTVTDAVGGSGSGLGGAATYYVQVSYVDYNGESEASTAISRAVGTADTWTLSWTAVTGALQYRIYVGTTATNCKLVRIIPATAYDGSGTIGAAATGYQFTAIPTTPTAEVTTAGASDYPIVATGGVRPENIVLWDLDAYQGLGKFAYTNSGGSRFNGLVTMQPLAQTDDFLPFLIKTYGALVPSFEATSVIHRGLRTA